ncbi:MAG: T9SS type A sorting domain-containing protein [Saprospiraceae bacterium]
MIFSSCSKNEDSSHLLDENQLVSTRSTISLKTFIDMAEESLNLTYGSPDGVHDDYDFISFDTINLHRPAQIENIVSEFSDSELITKYDATNFLDPLGVIEHGSLSQLFFVHDEYGIRKQYKDMKKIGDRGISMVVNDDKTIHLFGDSLIHLDEDFNYINSQKFTFGNFGTTGQRIMKVGDYYYYSAIGGSGSPNDYQDQFLMKVSEDFNLKGYINFSGLSEWGFFFNSLDIYNGYAFFGVMDIPGLPGGDWYKYFKIKKADLDLNEEWTLYYSEGLSYFCAGLIATSDGGVIAYGHHEDLYNINDFPFIFKFDKDGNLSTSVDQEIQPNIVKVLSNPSNGMFRLDLSGYVSNNMKVTLTDINGQQMYSEKIIDNHYAKDLTHLPAGVYIFTLYENSKPIITDRWIKQ